MEASVGNFCLTSFVFSMLSRSWVEALTRPGPEKGGSEADVALVYASSKSDRGSRPVRHLHNLGSYSFQLPSAYSEATFPSLGPRIFAPLFRPTRLAVRPRHVGSHVISPFIRPLRVSALASFFSALGFARGGRIIIVARFLRPHSIPGLGSRVISVGRPSAAGFSLTRLGPLNPGGALVSSARWAFAIE